MNVHLLSLFPRRLHVDDVLSRWPGRRRSTLAGRQTRLTIVGAPGCG
ncbi:MAG TPA: hypothetical protein VIJ82_11110 [Streptosporangiaceae bacterium]